MLAKSEWKDESLSYEPITDIITTPNAKQTWVHLTLDNGNTITTTDGHPFNTPEGWRNAILLKKGGQLLLKGEEGEPKTITITNISIETKHQTTYNLEVANAHTFFVGEDGVLVHNSTVQSNKTAGLSYEQDVVNDFNNDPCNCGKTAKLNKGKGSGYETPYGYRYPDVAVVDDATGDIVEFIECKLGKSRYKTSQKKKDNWILTNLNIPTRVSRKP